MIEVKHLSKFYGDFQAIRDLSFEIPEGHVYGFLGPNGAGKSTTMNILTGCLSPTEGQVLIDGFDIFEEPMQAKKRIGYLPEQPPLYLHETPEEYLHFVGEAKGVKGQELSDQIEMVIAKTRLEPVRYRKISALSKGYRQRVGIAQALLGNPGVIILDEPTVGLDPLQIIEIRDLIRELGKDHTVILSSHILSEVQALCEKIQIISAGQLVAYDSPEALESKMLSPELRLTTEADMGQTEQILTSLDLAATAMSSDSQGNTLVTLSAGEDNPMDLSRRLFFAFAEKNLAILELTHRKASLEDIFLQLTEGEEARENPDEEEEEETE